MFEFIGDFINGILILIKAIFYVIIIGILRGVATYMYHKGKKERAQNRR